MHPDLKHALETVLLAARSVANPATPGSQFPNALRRLRDTLKAHDAVRGKLLALRLAAAARTTRDTKP